MSVGEQCSWQHSMAHPRKPPYRRKNLAKISYASRVIATFVPNFVAMATGVGRGIMQLTAFDSPSPKTSYRRKNLAKISYASPVIAHFVPNFVAMATRGRGGNGEGKWGREREGKGKGKEKGKEKAKGKGRWKGDSLRNVGRMDAWTDTKVILYSVQCYA